MKLKKLQTKNPLYSYDVFLSVDNFETIVRRSFAKIPSTAVFMNLLTNINIIYQFEND